MMCDSRQPRKEEKTRCSVLLGEAGGEQTQQSFVRGRRCEKTPPTPDSPKWRRPRRHRRRSSRCWHRRRQAP
uniref:Uncharacterized protein n=1 Tax=Aegilops tauschii subsp. strangulata TaxID=200361 RepID=A0A453PIB8_AEGTS